MAKSILSIILSEILPYNRQTAHLTNIHLSLTTIYRKENQTIEKLVCITGNF